MCLGREAEKRAHTRLGERGLDGRSLSHRAQRLAGGDRDNSGGGGNASR